MNIHLSGRMHQTSLTFPFSFFLLFRASLFGKPFFCRKKKGFQSHSVFIVLHFFQSSLSIRLRFLLSRTHLSAYVLCYERLVIKRLAITLTVATDCMLGGQPNHAWQLCFPLLLHAGGSDFRLYDGSDLKTYLLMRW